MKISIGLLAHNEETTIASTIKQVMSQDVFEVPGCIIQFVIVVNGCTDNTMAIAERTVIPYQTRKNLFATVVNLEQAGKSNAWNEYVHTIAWNDADYLVLVDADIEFGSKNVIKRLVESLEVEPDAVVAVDQVKKDIEKQLRKSILSRLSLKVSELRKKDERPAIAGSLYCARGKVIRRIYMPVGLPVEDGFLRAMVVTDNFTHTDDDSKIIVVNDVCHYFEAILSPVKLYKHERRLILGSTINAMLYNYLWSNVTKTGKDAGMIINELNINEPGWLINLIEEYKLKKGFWLVPRSLALKHTINIINGRHFIIKKIILLPIAFVASVTLIAISINVNLFFRNNNGVGHW